MSNDTSKLPLRLNVCMIVTNQEDKIFLGERAGDPGHWQFPQGGVESDRPLEDEVIRELYEELGAPKECFRIIKKLHSTHSYDWETVPEYAKGKWRGQSQSFWLVEFSGNDQQIRLDPTEFSNYRWLNSQEVKELAHPQRMPSYLLPLREFEDYLLLRGEL